MTTIEIGRLQKPYIRRRATDTSRKADCGFAVNGQPLLLHGTAAALRAMEIDADVLIKATKVDA